MQSRGISVNIDVPSEGKVDSVNGTTVRASKTWRSTSQGQRPSRNLVLITKDGRTYWARIERKRNSRSTVKHVKHAAAAQTTQRSSDTTMSYSERMRRFGVNNVD